MANEVPSVEDDEALRKEEERKLAEAKKRVEMYERIQSAENKEQIVQFDYQLWEPENYQAKVDAGVEALKEHANEKGKKIDEDAVRKSFSGYRVTTLPKEQFLTTYKTSYETAKQYVETHKQPENQQGNGGKPQTEPTVGEQGNKAEEKEKIDIADQDVDFALRAVPTYVQDFMKVHKMLPEEHKWMNTRELKAYLTNAEFDKEQKAQLTEYLKDRERRKAEFVAYTKDPTKQSMKEDYVKVAQAKAKREQALKEAQEQLKTTTTKALEEEAKKVMPTQADLDKALNVKIEPINVHKPVVKVGKTEVLKNNGKKKEKDAIIVTDGENTYALTKAMVKEVRDTEGKDAFPSFKKMKKAAENGILDPDVVKYCYVKASQLELKEQTAKPRDIVKPVVEIDENKLNDDIKKPVEISLPFKKGREM